MNEERRRGLYIGARGRWSLPQVAPPLGRASLGRRPPRPLGLGAWAKGPTLGPLPLFPMGPIWPIAYNSPFN